MSSQAPQQAQPQPVNTFASSAFPGSAAFGNGFATGFTPPTDVSNQAGYETAAQAFSNYGQDQLKQQGFTPGLAGGYNMQYQQMSAAPAPAAAPAASKTTAYSYQQPASAAASASDASASASSSQSAQQALPAGLPAPVYPSQAVSGMPPGLSPQYNGAVFNPYGQQFPANPYMQYQNMYNMAAYGYQVRTTLDPKP